MSKPRTIHRIPMGLRGPGILAQHGYTDEVRRKISEAQRGRPHPQRKERCSCGRITTPGPMVMHTRATGHRVVERVRRA